MHVCSADTRKYSYKLVNRHTYLIDIVSREKRLLIGTKEYEKLQYVLALRFFVS